MRFFLPVDNSSSENHSFFSGLLLKQWLFFWNIFDFLLFMVYINICTLALAHMEC